MRIRGVAPFGENFLPARIGKSGFLKNSIMAFIRKVEEKTGGTLIIDPANFPDEDPALAPCAQLAGTLLSAGVITGLERLEVFPDEPRAEHFVAPIATKGRAGGGGWSFASAGSACMSALAEALERYLWKHTDDHFTNERRARERDLKSGSYVPLSRFAGFSDKQRETLPALQAQSETAFSWIEGRSYVSRKVLLIPTHVASAYRESRPQGNMPLVRPTITTGLATAASKEGALVAGALEVIERDAFMVTYLNKISAPRIDLEALAKSRPSLRRALDSFKRYHMTPYAFSLLTDAPVHVVGAVLTDDTGGGPAFSMGAAARFTFADAVEKALTEALAGRHSIRARNLKDLPALEKFKIEERTAYWGRPENAPRMRWLTEGPIETPRELLAPAAASAQLDILLSFCKEKGYEFLSVDIGRSPKNPTDLFVEFVVIPELQPMHLIESYPCFGGARLSEVPRALGFEPAKKINTEPHPFP